MMQKCRGCFVDGRLGGRRIVVDVRHDASRPRREHDDATGETDSFGDVVSDKERCGSGERCKTWCGPKSNALPDWFGRRYIYEYITQALPPTKGDPLRRGTAVGGLVGVRDEPT